MAGDHLNYGDRNCVVRKGLVYPFRDSDQSIRPRAEELPDPRHQAPESTQFASILMAPVGFQAIKRGPGPR